MQLTKDKVRPLDRNRIKLTIDRLCGESEDDDLRNQIIERLMEELKTKNRLTMILNNKQQPTVAELTIIAQVLSTSMDDLIVLQDAPPVHI